MNDENLNYDENENRDKRKNLKFNKSKTLNFLLSLVPGAGHMYLGYMQKGILIMSSFFIILNLTGWMGIPILDFLAPVIWAYSFFDANHLFNGDGPIEDNGVDKLLEKIKVKYIGYVLIAAGILALIQQVLIPILAGILPDSTMFYEIERYFRTVIVALIFIYGGYRLIKYNKTLGEIGDIDEE